MVVPGVPQRLVRLAVRGVREGLAPDALKVTQIVQVRGPRRIPIQIMRQPHRVDVSVE